MAVAAQASRDKCPNGHEIQDVGIQCTTCRDFILFTPEVYETRRVASLTYASVILLSTMAALVLSRFTTQNWPLYAFLVLGVVLLYTTLFSRGETLGVAAWILGGVGVIWLMAELGTRVFGLRLSLGSRSGTIELLAALVVWTLATVFMHYIGSTKTLYSIHTGGSYFITAGTFTLGFWGVWLVLLENGLGTRTAFQVAIGVGLFLPLICVAFLFGKRSRELRLGQNRRLDLATLWLVVVAAYLILIEPLIHALAFALGRFLPQLIGVPTLADVTVDWLGGPNWRALITSGLLLIAATLVAVHSAIEVTEARKHDGAPSDKATPVHERPKVPQPPLTEGEEVEAEFEEFAEAAVAAAVVAATQARFAGGFFGALAIAFARNVIATFQRLINVVLPIFVFSILGLLITLALGVYRDYGLHGAFFNAVSLWGLAISVMALVVLLCGISFEFAPSREKRQRRGRPLFEAGAAAMLAGLVYFLLSLASLALLPMWFTERQGGGGQFSALAPGGIYFANLAISVGALAVLALLNLGLFRRFADKKGFRVTFYGVSTASVLVLIAASALYFGFQPIRAAATVASVIHSPSAESRVRSLVPAAPSGTCTPDRLLLSGYEAGVRCQVSEVSGEVSYHAFASSDDLNHWYQQAIAARGIRADSGKCGSTLPADNPYSRAGRSGRLACYVDRAGAWLVWTDDGSKVMSIAHSGSIGPDRLFAAWMSGALDPQAASSA
jgi:hypothetical protein